MGVVYRAEDPTIGRTVAIKTIRLGDLSDSSEREFMRERLLREARSAGMLSHPGIVTIYDIYEEGDTAYVFMEFVNGQPLEMLMAEGPPPEKETLIDYLRQTAAALDYAHAKGIVHRDIKPANIMISVDGEAKITDFGVAKILSQQMTQTRSVFGTPYYMSPEQIQGGQIDGRSDQFALGVIAYELITGERPYVADALPTLLFKIVKETPPSPDRVNPSLAPEVGKPFEKVFAKEPSGRFSTCSEFVNALALAANKNPEWRPLPRGESGDLRTIVSGAGRPAPPPGGEPAPVATDMPPPPKRPPAPPPVEATQVSQGASLPRIARTRPRRSDEEAEEPQSNLLRNLVVAVFMLALIGGGVYAYFEHFEQIRAFFGPPTIPVDTEGESPLADAGEPLRQVDSSLEPLPPPPPPIEEEAAEEPAVGGEAGGIAPPAESPAREPPKPEPAPKAESRKPAAPAKPKIHWVQIQSNPPGAVAMADEDRQLRCTTPCELPLEPGRHVVRLTMAGHRLSPRIIQVPNVTSVTVNLDRMAGTLAITSKPPGAEIYLNGERQSEETPAMIKLPVGTYQIRLVLPGKPEFTDSVNVRDQVITSVGVEW